MEAPMVAMMPQFLGRRVPGHGGIGPRPLGIANEAPGEDGAGGGENGDHPGRVGDRRHERAAVAENCVEDGAGGMATPGRNSAS